MKRKLVGIISAAVAVLTFSSGLTTFADTAKEVGNLYEGHTQDLIVVKYGLAEDQNLSKDQTTNDGAEINGRPVDDAGQELKPLANIEYTVQPVKPTKDRYSITAKDKDSYVTTGDATSIVTNDEGKAQVNLPDGYYLISELPNKAANLKKPMAPVIIKLPVMNASSNGFLSQVYLYPKSSVAKDVPVIPSTPGPGTKNPPSKTPSKTPKKKTKKPTIPPTGNPVTKVVREIQKSLPHTGETINFGLSVFGFAIVLAIVYIEYRRRKSAK
jgi:LPXTG-motif cell wall-anchored protein